MSPHATSNGPWACSFIERSILHPDIVVQQLLSGTTLHWLAKNRERGLYKGVDRNACKLGERQRICDPIHGPKSAMGFGYPKPCCLLWYPFTHVICRQILIYSPCSDIVIPLVRARFCTMDVPAMISRIESNSPKAKRTKNVIRDWGWEICAWVVASSTLLVTILLLLVFNGRPVSRWSSKVQFSALIAALAQTSQSSLLVCLASCIGQLKWLWFHKKDRPTIDLEKFDKSSRGPDGSLRLLLQWSRPYVPILHCH